jgi:apolipoprotein N-acyltransferase
MGISCTIDPDGRVVALPGPDWAQSKKIATVVRGSVPIDDRPSIYTRGGDWLPLACWFLVPVLILMGIRRARRPAA